ncbi:formate dehydrogenase subunit gamma [Luteimonas sp. MJ204]|uniref:formate dehydrogenase subunit gamma n=1 Tax=Luteimonas sp. MJ145 TaxID=3129234 RepID=UPI0031BA3E9B
MTEHRPPREILRYSANERTNHWLVAISFVLAGLSGLALYHPAMSWLSALFGGGPWTRILHPFIGVFMFVVFFLFAARMWGSNRIEARDRQWLRQIDDVAAGREDRLPEVGRYNAGQKLLFWALVACMLGLLATGVVMWQPWFAPAFPIGFVRFASVLHAILATVIICMIIFHAYAGLWVKGSMRAMLQGPVTRGWAWKHHRGWLRELDRDTDGK